MSEIERFNDMRDNLLQAQSDIRNALEWIDNIDLRDPDDIESSLDRAHSDLEDAELEVSTVKDYCWHGVRPELLAAEYSNKRIGSKNIRRSRPPIRVRY